MSQTSPHSSTAERDSLTACPVCGSERRASWLTALGFSLVRCADCGHRYSAEVLTARRLSHAYYEEHDADLAARTMAAKRQRFVQYAEALPEVFARPGRVLDVGCNAGELLSLFQERGWQVAGVEMSPNPAAYAAKRLNAPVFNGPIEDYQLDGPPFDLITMVHLLEHLHDPGATLRRLRDWLAPGGGLLIEVPNADDMLLPLLRGSYRPLCPGDHVSFFDERSLARLLTDCDLSLQRCLSPMQARDIFYGSALSLIDAVRTRGGAQLSGAGGVESQVRYRGRFRRPLKRALDVVVEAVDPAVLWAQQQLAPARGSVLIAYAPLPS